MAKQITPKQALETARKLAPKNPYIQKMLDEPAKKQTEKYSRQTEQLAETMNTLSKIFHEPPSPIILTQPSKTIQPLKLPPSHHTLSKKTTNQRIQEHKMALERIKTAQNGSEDEKMIKDPSQQKKSQNEPISAIRTQTRIGRPPKQPTLRYYQELAQRQTDQNTNPTQPHQTDIENYPHQTEDPAGYDDDNTSTATTTTSISTSTDADVEQQAQIPTAPSITPIGATAPEPSTKTSTKRRGRPPKNILQHRKKVSQPYLPSSSLTEVEKVSRAVPIIYGAKQITSKTALTLTQIYSQELTPEEITMLLEHRDELHLTHAELTALSLLAQTEYDKEARKQYWKIQETLERSKKQPTSINPSNATLLEQKLATAEEAIFGEVITKPIDKSEQPE